MASVASVTHPPFAALVGTVASRPDLEDWHRFDAIRDEHDLEQTPYHESSGA
jgi:hypothetical protein